MQRVLFEILRRSQFAQNENPERVNKKRKFDGPLAEDGKYAEQRYSPETRGARPGRTDWTSKKRRAELEWQAADMRRMHTAAH